MTALAGFPLVLAYASLPVLGNLAGAFLAERAAITERKLSLALHAATGVVVGIVAIELLPTALAIAPPWVTLAAFVAGGLFFIGLDHVTRHVSVLFAGEHPRGDGAAWSVFAGVSLDLFSDGVMLGAAATLSPGLGLLLALGQVPADAPEGYASMAAFKREGVTPARRRALALALALPIFLGASLGYFLLRNRPEVWQVAVLTFTAGALMTLLVEEIVPEAHTGQEGRVAALVFLGGFAVFFAVSTLLG